MSVHALGQSSPVTPDQFTQEATCASPPESRAISASHAQPSTTPGVVVDISAQARAEASSQPAGFLHRAAQATLATALEAAYLTELIISEVNYSPKNITLQQYAEEYDVGVVLNYFLNRLNGPTSDESTSYSIRDIADEAWNKMERWGEWLRGPKREFIEWGVSGIAIGTALGYGLTRLNGHVVPNGNSLSRA